MNESIPAASITSTAAVKKTKPWHRLLPLLITAACFAYLYSRLSHGAAAEGSRLFPYLLKSFENVSWPRWLALLFRSCFLFLVLDALLFWIVFTCFMPKSRYAIILPF